jgi:hypothetical protein
VPRMRTRRDGQADARNAPRDAADLAQGNTASPLLSTGGGASLGLTRYEAWQVRARPFRQVRARSQRGTQAQRATPLSSQVSSCRLEHVLAIQSAEMADSCCCGVAPTSFQCAARGPHAAQATRRARCRDQRSVLKERVAAGVTPSRQRCERRGSAGLGTAACQHHWRVGRLWRKGTRDRDASVLTANGPTPTT